jgi:hypothetical protein
VTEETECKQQENWIERNVDPVDTTQIGQQWAFCDPETQETELPDCECGNSDDGSPAWTPDAADCRAVAADGSGPVFKGCPALEEYLAQCPGAKLEDEQPWCETIQKRCKQQSHSDVYKGMVGQYWSYCDPEEQEPNYPWCECKEKWTHEENKCYGKGYNREMEGCPSLHDLRYCEAGASQSWCDTTYQSCDSQGPKSGDDEGWSYCDPETNYGEYADCECSSVWKFEPDDESDFSVEDQLERCPKKKFTGCPTLEEIQECAPDEEYSYCSTEQWWCKQQVEGDSAGNGWVACDPESNRATGRSSKKAVGMAIGITFLVTVIVCTLCFLGLVMGVRQYLNKHKKSYHELGASKAERLVEP